MNLNIAARIENQAKNHPDKKAIFFPKKRSEGSPLSYDSLTFSEFNNLASEYAWGLESHGVRMGDRVLIFVRPALHFPALVFALFKLGATPVLIDPGMGKKNLLKAIKDVKPRVLISEPIVHVIRHLYSSSFKGIELFFTTKLFGGTKLKSILGQKSDYPAKTVTATDLAAILFTSGGTGAPKGVEYTHPIFNAQTDRLQEMFKLESSDIDIPGFPLFSFFTLAMGMSSVTPEMDPARPSQCDPKKIVEAIVYHKATFVAGSPAIWERVADYCLKNNLILDSIKSVVMFGAPVRYELHEKFEKVLPNGNTFTPYGATECLPVANVSGADVLRYGKEAARSGKGIFLGPIVQATHVAIIKVTDDAIHSMNDAQILAPYEVGEIIVKADVATRAYFENEGATKLSKITDGERFWHRMGDLGYLDSAGQLWFLGRKTHRVNQGERIIPSISFESIFNHNLGLKRTALIAIGKDAELGLVVEGTESSELRKQILELAQNYEHTRDLKHVFFRPQFPLDVRHNIKIDRTRLGREINQERGL